MLPWDWPIDGHRGLYGDTDEIEWKDAATVAEEAERAGAIRQHQAAKMLNDAIKGGALGVNSRESLSRRLGHPEDYLGRTLRGERWATLADLAEWAVAARKGDIFTGGTPGETLVTELLQPKHPLPPDPKPDKRGSE